MEDDDGQESIRRWMKYTGFSFQSLLTRQILSAISGLLVDLLITPLLVPLVDADLRSSSLKRVLLLTLVSMLLAFIFRLSWINFKSLKWNSSPGMDMDMDAACYTDGISPTDQQMSDYSVFTSFRFPVMDNLLPGPPRQPVAEDAAAAQVDSNQESAPVYAIRSEPPRLSSSLSEPQSPPPPPPSYQPQWVTSASPPPSSSHQPVLPSALPSPMQGKGKFTTSRRTTRLKNMNPNPKASLLHQSLLHPMNTHQASKPFEIQFRKQEVDSETPQKKGLLKNRARTASACSPQASSWAWEFMEKASFDQFKRDYANFRSINSSLLGAFATDTDTLRAEASRWTKGRGESDANERQKTLVSLGKEDNHHHQLQKPPPAPGRGSPASLQAATLELNPRVRKMVGTKTKCSGCLKAFMPSFCFQRQKRVQRRWNSRRFRQISQTEKSTTAVVFSPPSHYHYHHHHLTPTGRCI